MYNYKKSVLSPYDPTKLAIHSILHPEDDRISNCGPNVKKTVSFVDLQTPTKIRQINRERNYISRSCEKPQCFPSNDQHTCFVDEQHISNMFLNPYNLWDMVPAALMSLNHTNDTYSLFNQYPQPTAQQPRTDSFPVFSSLRTMDSKRKGLRVSFAFFQKKLLPDGRMNETVSTVEEVSDLWKPGAMDGTSPFVMICNCF